MKKWCIMLAFAMLLLSGCGKQAESTEVATEESNTEEPEPATTEALETVVLKDAKIGDIVQMGTYEQDGDAETEDPICWDVLCCVHMPITGVNRGPDLLGCAG